ncbi:MAG TPA: NIPSNAP family protein [Steroidobacteraceae bacterium]|nr:NIPSNAP family protein [Steroidobacteraceae bacterium]
MGIYRTRLGVEHAAMDKPLAWMLAGTIGCVAMGGPTDSEPSAEQCCSVLELRQYLTKPGRRDDLIALVDDHLLEGQEAHAMRVVGQFRNPRAPDRWVWMRGFSDMESRHRALTDFYQGALWKQHSAAANDTMVDVSDVLLLKPASVATQLRVGGRPANDAAPSDGGLVVVTINYLREPADARFLSFFAQEAIPLLQKAGAAVRGQFVTEASPNTFKGLPVREGEDVFLWIASFSGPDAYECYKKSLAGNGDWAARIEPELRERVMRPTEVIELLPTRRSRLRHPPVPEH